MLPGSLATSDRGTTLVEAVAAMVVMALVVGVAGATITRVSSVLDRVRSRTAACFGLVTFHTDLIRSAGRVEFAPGVTDGIAAGGSRLEIPYLDGRIDRSLVVEPGPTGTLVRTGDECRSYFSVHVIKTEVVPGPPAYLVVTATEEETDDEYIFVAPFALGPADLRPGGRGRQ